MICWSFSRASIVLQTTVIYTFRDWIYPVTYTPVTTRVRTGIAVYETSSCTRRPIVSRAVTPGDRVAPNLQSLSVRVPMVTGVQPTFTDILPLYSVNASHYLNIQQTTLLWRQIRRKWHQIMTRRCQVRQWNQPKTLLSDNVQHILFKH